MTDFALSSSRATHCHALNRTGSLSSGMMRVGDVENACLALGRRKEHMAPILSHNLMYALTGYLDNTPLLAAGDMPQGESQICTGETGKVSMCLKKKKASQKKKNLLLNSIKDAPPFTGEYSIKIHLHGTTVKMAYQS